MDEQPNLYFNPRGFYPCWVLVTLGFAVVFFVSGLLMMLFSPLSA